MLIDLMITVRRQLLQMMLVPRQLFGWYRLIVQFCLMLSSYPLCRWSLKWLPGDVFGIAKTWRLRV
jgi:hypothetical protein